MKLLNKILAIGGLSLIITGCGLLDPVPAPVIKYYKLDFNGTKDMTAGCSVPQNAPVMQISIFKVDDPFNTHSMYYSKNTSQLMSYTENKWVAIPAKMLTQVTQEKLLGSCLYSNVISSDFMTSSNYRLAAQVLDFKQVIANESSVMQLSVLVQLIDNKSNSVIMSKVFAEQSSTTPDISGYVNGANKVTNMYLDNLVTWLSSNHPEKIEK